MIRWIPSRPNIEAYELDIQLIVPAAAVGHIIGRHGRRVRQLESYASVRIWTLNAPQPPPTPTGVNRSRVKITGNFWHTQVGDAAECLQCLLRRIISLECYQCKHFKSNNKLSRSGIQESVVDQVIDQL